MLDALALDGYILRMGWPAIAMSQLSVIITLGAAPWAGLLLGVVSITMVLAPNPRVWL